MRIVIAKCSVVYTGRGDTRMEEAVRAIIIKNDGSVSIHADKSNKPLNYMGKGNVFTVDKKTKHKQVWTFETRKESLQIFITKIVSDTSFSLSNDDAGLVRDGTENHLQGWLAENPQTIGYGFTLVSREFATGAGAVDLLLEDTGGRLIAVEVKRTALSATVYQTLRYVDALKDQFPDKEVLGYIVALDVRPNTLILAEKRKVVCVTVPSNWKEL